MDQENCHVKVEDLKRHLRITSSDLDDQLILALMAAYQHIENFTLLNIEEDYKDKMLPYPIKIAILMTAGRLFESTADAIFNLPTAAMNLANPYKRWDRIRRQTPEGS